MNATRRSATTARRNADRRQAVVVVVSPVVVSPVALTAAPAGTSVIVTTKLFFSLIDVVKPHACPLASVAVHAYVVPAAVDAGFSHFASLRATCAAFSTSPLFLLMKSCV